MPLREFLELMALGAASGALGALLGIGGGVLLVPGLALIAGVPFRAAAAASLVCIVATSITSSVVHLPRGRVDIPLAIDLEAFTVSGAMIGGLLAAVIPAGPLFLGFALILLFSAWHMWPFGRTERAPATRRRMGLARASSLGAGVVSSLLGVGGGVLKVPVLNLMLDLPFDRAAATSIYMIGITTAAGALVYAVRGDVDVHLTVAVMLGTVLGSFGASSVGHRIDSRGLKAVFAIVLAGVAIQMVRRGLALP
ncbi:MAG: sulfite exporter TauE/SafE family protein [Gemmatimonadetes bacterium]|nr:sulfite exporter TauE/SafE family protein [Gemmatimonadota bacterium]